MALALKNYETGKYFAKGKWTADASLAENFAGEEELLKAVAEHHIPCVEMVLLDEENRYVAGVRMGRDGARAVPARSSSELSKI